MRFNNNLALSAVSIAVTTLVVGCGGGSGGGTHEPPPVAKVACGWNTGVELAYEEKRLETPLPSTGTNVTTNDTTPFATRIVKATGFDQFAPGFAQKLCADDGKTTVVSYDKALETVKAEGATLWRAAVDRVQGRRTQQSADDTAPLSDDRMLYWARVQMTKVLRQWAPDFALTAEQKTELQWQFERSSRGQHDIDFPTGNNANGKPYRRMIMSGFDVFTLGNPGTPGTGLRNGNPSGATALEMDGREFTLSDGSTLRVESYVLPVSYDPFNLGMQEDTIGPWFKPGPKQVDASISVSQGGANQFWIEEYNGRFHGPSAGNDGMVYCPSGANRIPGFRYNIGDQTITGTPAVLPATVSLPGSGCDVYPPQRWLGYDSVSTWQKDWPPQFSRTTLPVTAMVTGTTQAGVVRPVGATSEGTEGFDVTWHTNYTYFPDCSNPATMASPSTNLMNAMPATPPVDPAPSACAQAGGGGNYLSNESAYRNTLMRDTFNRGPSFPAGHIHVPVMNNYYTGTGAIGGTRNDNAISDGRYEQYRTAIVQQTKNLMVVVGQSLVPSH